MGMFQPAMWVYQRVNTLRSIPDSWLRSFHWKDFHGPIQRVSDKNPVRTKPQPKPLWWSKGSLEPFQWTMNVNWMFWGLLIFLKYFKGGYVKSRTVGWKSWKPWKVSCNPTTLSDACLMRLEFSEVQEKLGWSQILWHGKDVMMKGSLHYMRKTCRRPSEQWCSKI